MSISEIKNKLYKKEGTEDPQQFLDSEFDPRRKPSMDSIEPKREKEVWLEDKKGLSDSQKKIIKIGLITFGALIIIIGTFLGIYKYKVASFGLDRVTVSFDGPNESGSGKLLTYEITYKNDNRASLKNAVLRLSYPENFKPEQMTGFTQDGPTIGSFNLGEVPSFSTGKATFSGRMFSPKGALIYLKAELVYTPSNSSSQFISKNQLGINITTSPISLEVLAPQNVASGDAVNYLISYKNEGEEPFENIKLKVDYPEGFVFSKSDPASLEGNNIWYIGNLDKGQAGKVTVSGKLEGARGEAKNVRASIGSIDQGNFVSYSEESTVTKISGSPLSISQTVNGVTSLNANAGEVLRFIIKYKNDGDIGLKDVIITEKIDSPSLDYTKLEIDKGSFDDQKKTITWKASDYPNLRNLEPGQEGLIRFNIPVKSVLPVGGANDKNFVISSLAKIDSPDIPTPIDMNKIIAGNGMDIKVNSKLVIDQKGYYNDTAIPNSGPIPPTVGQETTYTIHWLASNVSNDIKDAKVVATLPTGVSMTGKIIPEDASVDYNERTNEIVWNIGSLSAGTGILNTPKELIFQIKIKPSSDQIGQVIDLSGAPTFSATDNFTGSAVKATGERKTTFLSEDKKNLPSKVVAGS